MSPRSTTFSVLNLSIIALSLLAWEVNGTYCRPPYEQSSDGNCYWIRIANSSISRINYLIECRESGGEFVFLENEQQHLALREMLLAKVDASNSYNVAYFLGMDCTAATGLLTNLYDDIQSYHPGLNASNCTTSLQCYSFMKPNFTLFENRGTGTNGTGIICQFFKPKTDIFNATTCPSITLPNTNPNVEIWHSRNRCFIASEFPMYYADARYFCRTKFEADLIEILLKEEYDEVTGHLDAAGKYVVGLFHETGVNLTGGDGYFWLSGMEFNISGTNATLLNLAENSSATGMCGSIQKVSPGVDFTECQLQSKFICSMPLQLSSDYGLYCRSPYELADDGNCYAIKYSPQPIVNFHIQCVDYAGVIVDLKTREQLESLQRLLVRKRLTRTQYAVNYFIGVKFQYGAWRNLYNESITNFNISWATGHPLWYNGSVQLDNASNFSKWITVAANTSAGTVCQFLTPNYSSSETCAQSVSGANVFIFKKSCIYHFKNSPKSWPDARYFCQQNGLGDLVINVSVMLQAVPATYVINDTWIGVRRSSRKDFTNLDFYWVNGSVLENQNWTGNPNSLVIRKNCLVLHQRSDACLESTCNYRITDCSTLKDFACEKIITADDCYSSPCVNGGICFSSTDAYNCTCPAGFEGINCEVNIQECSSSPCVNSGTCIDGANRFNCSCSAGFNGIQCETNVNECSSSPCANGATCSDWINGYNCTCQQGYTGTVCQTNINECTSHPCLHGGTCVDGVNRFDCSCTAGYSGTNCEVDINECSSNPCGTGATCTDFINSYNCTCAPGFEGLTCQNNTNECGSSPCLNDATCLDAVNGYSCDCAPGFEGLTCQNNTNECGSSPCLDGGTCIDGTNRYNCSCPAGYSGTTCETNINECSSNPCLNGATCLDLINSYNCTCPIGFAGVRCEEALATTQLTTAQPQATTSQLTSTLSQSLQTTTGATTVHAATSQSQSQSQSISTSSGEHSTADSSGTTAAAAAAAGTASSVSTATGQSTSGAPTVPTSATSSEHFSDLTEASVPPPVESMYPTAPVPTEEVPSASPEETARRGLSGMIQYNPALMKSHIDPCTTTPCLNNATCMSYKTTYACDCPAHTAGDRCQQSVDRECSGPSPCLRGSLCYFVLPDNDTLRFCDCSHGLAGSICETNIDECQSSPCLRGTCLDAIGYYTCSCERGFTGVQCEYELDECTSHPCRGNSTCTDLVATYACTCIAGLTGKSCEVNIDDCADAHCQNGGYCEDGLGNFTCHCPTYYSGTSCEQKAQFLVTVKAVSRSFAAVASAAIIGMFITVFGLDVVKLACPQCNVKLKPKKLKKAIY